MTPITYYGHYNIDNVSDKVLIDTKKNGKENIDWKGKKENSILLSESYRRLKMISKSSRVYDCSTFLEFKRYHDDTLKLNQANFCKVRLCPLCSWRRSLKVFGQVSKVMDEVTKNKDYEFLFLTLTTRNCESNYLSNTIDNLMRAFNLMTKRKLYKKSILGHFRALEITHNIDNDTYHPHFHCILMVNKSYFTDKKYYISQQEWTSLWKDVLRVNYTPIVDVRKFKDIKGQGVTKGVAEVAKYTVKDNDYIIKDSNGEVIFNLTDAAVYTLDKAMANRRLTAFGGILKEIHQLLNLDDIEEGNLIHTDNDEIREDLEYIIERYHWHIGYRQYIKID